MSYQHKACIFLKFFVSTEHITILSAEKKKNLQLYTCCLQYSYQQLIENLFENNFKIKSNGNPGKGGPLTKCTFKYV